ncbi:MAG: isochorismatase family cysteine hydrolase [Candidatus Brocadiia bacterium]
MDARAVFWDVDTQHDFMDEDGKLAVPGAQDIVENLARLTDFAVNNGIPVIASADAHPPDDPEFEEFGQHCVAGTPGQQKIPQTQAPRCETADRQRLGEQLAGLREGDLHQLVIEKEDLDVFTVSLADTVVDALDAGRIFVYGVATEYCVQKTVLGLLARNQRVALVQDAIRGIDASAATEALDRMRQAGAHLTETDSILSELENA